MELMEAPRKDDGIERMPWQKKQPWRAQSHYRFEVCEKRENGDIVAIFATDAGSATTKQDAAKLYTLLLRQFGAVNYAIRVEKWEMKGQAITDPRVELSTGDPTLRPAKSRLEKLLRS